MVSSARCFPFPSAKSAGLWIALGCSCACCVVQAGPVHLEAFAAYQTAFAQGDLPSTIEHAQAAWQAAETELGDSATTAILAYNYARSAFSYEQTRALARDAYQRVLSLSTRGIGEFRTADLQIALHELALLGGDLQANALELENLLWERRREGLPPTELSAHAWKSLATEQLRQLDLSTAARHADIAADEAESLRPADPDLLSEVQLLSAVARLSDSGCVDEPEQIHIAIERLDRTIALVSPYPANPAMVERKQTAMEWRDSAQKLAERLRRSRSHVNAKYWPRR